MPNRTIISLLLPYVIAWLLAHTAEAQVANTTAFRACASRISGLRLIYRGEAAYESARDVTHNLRVLPNRRPFVIGFPPTASAAAALLLCSKSARLRVSVRAGGHNYEGLCMINDGVVIDTSQMTSIRVVQRGTTQVAVIGAGQRLGPVTRHLWQTSGKIISTGQCESVGVAGSTLGGGIGPNVRMAGLTSDSLVEAQIVTAAGQVLTVNATSHSDLLFALRGGGGNFGLVTSFTFRLITPPNRASILRVGWPNTRDNIRAVTAAFLNWKPYLLPRPYSYVQLTIGRGSRNPDIRVYYWGPKKDLEQLYARQAVFKVGQGQRLRTLEEMPMADFLAYQHNPGSNRPLSQLTLDAVIRNGLLDRPLFEASSLFLTANVSETAVNRLAEVVNSRKDVGFVQIKAMGGAVNSVASNTTAFPHRATRYLVLIKIHENNLKWVRDIEAELRPAASGQYLNYYDADVSNTWQAYFGSNAARLRTIKQKWDPQGVFDALTKR